MRGARSVMEDLAASGLTPDQLALVMELSATLTAEARPQTDNAAERRRAKDREYQADKRRHNRQISADSPDAPALDKEPPQTPKEIKPTPLPPIPSSEGIAPASLNGHSEPDESPDQPVLKPEHVLQAWNDLANRYGLPLAVKLTDARQKHLKNFVRRNSIDEVRAGLDAIERSGFLRGENDRGWRADLDFFLQPKSFAKLIEGAYDH